MLCSLQASQFYTAIYLRGVLLYLINDIFNEKFNKKKKKKKKLLLLLLLLLLLFLKCHSLYWLLLHWPGVNNTPKAFHVPKFRY